METFLYNMTPGDNITTCFASSPQDSRGRSPTNEQQLYFQLRAAVLPEILRFSILHSLVYAALIEFSFSFRKEFFEIVSLILSFVICFFLFLIFRTLPTERNQDVDQDQEQIDPELQQPCKHLTSLLNLEKCIIFYFC